MDVGALSKFQWARPLEARQTPASVCQANTVGGSSDGFVPSQTNELTRKRPGFEPAPTNLPSSLRRFLFSLGAVTALSGVFGIAPAVAATQIAELDSKAEAKILEDSNSCGKLVRLSKGSPGQGIHLSIHGLGADPASMAPLTQKAETNGQATATFAYNTMHCDHRQNTEALASELKGWLVEHPGENITVETHSMGGRMILGALYHLQNANEMPSQAIRLNMVAPPLAGFGLFNLCLAMPGPVARMIPGAAATRDMASLSGAQKQLDQLSVPGNVKTTIYYGDNDGWIDYTTPGAARMANKLEAQVYYLAGPGHYEMVDAVAKASPDQLSSVPLSYLPKARQSQDPVN